MSKRYFYVHVLTPVGPGMHYISTDHHPLHPDEEAVIQDKLIHLVAQQTGHLGLERKQFPIMKAIELEEEVARARWPEDFKGLILPP